MDSPNYTQHFTLIGYVSNCILKNNLFLTKKHDNTSKLLFSVVYWICFQISPVAARTVPFNLQTVQTYKLNLDYWVDGKQATQHVGPSLVEQ